MSTETMFALGLLLVSFGLDEKVNGTKRIPVKLIVGIVLLILVTLAYFGYFHTVRLIG